MKIAIPTLLILLFASCATLFNGPLTRVDIHTTKPATIVVNNDTSRSECNNVSINVKRQKKDLEITTITDTIKKTYQINPGLSVEYLGNIFFCYGIGYAIDLLTPKIWAYPKNIYIDPTSNDTNYKIFGNYNHSGELYLNVSIPEFNFMNQYTRFAGTRINSGCMGISAGMDYFYKSNQFVNLTYAMVTTFDFPIPVPVEYFGPYESAYSKYVSVSNNHRFYFMSFGYGLSFSENVWKYLDGGFWGYSNNTDYPVFYNIKKQNYAIGMIFPVYCKLGRNFNVGFIYRPSFYRPFEKIPFKYEHLISVDFAWKFRVKR